MGELTIWHWAAAFIVAAIGATSTTLNYLAGRRERQRVGREASPQIRATINRTYFEDGWRSVQLHVVPLGADHNAFRYENWRIEHVRLIWPKSAVLARAVDDDYASGLFYPNNPVRDLEGKPQGRPQRFALECFIKFEGAQDGQMAVFKVMFSNVESHKRYKKTVQASVPDNGEIV